MAEMDLFIFSFAYFYLLCIYS